MALTRDYLLSLTVGDAYTTIGEVEAAAPADLDQFEGLSDLVSWCRMVAACQAS